MPNNKQGSGQSNQDKDRMSQGHRGGYGDTTREAGGGQQNRNVDQEQQRNQSQSGSQKSGSRSGGFGGNDDEM